MRRSSPGPPSPGTGSPSRSRFPHRACRRLNRSSSATCLFMATLWPCSPSSGGSWPCFVQSSVLPPSRCLHTSCFRATRMSASGPEPDKRVTLPREPGRSKMSSSWPTGTVIPIPDQDTVAQRGGIAGHRSTAGERCWRQTLRLDGPVEPWVLQTGGPGPDSRSTTDQRAQCPHPRLPEK